MIRNKELRNSLFRFPCHRENILIQSINMVVLNNYAKGEIVWRQKESV